MLKSKQYAPTMFIDNYMYHEKKNLNLKYFRGEISNSTALLKSTIK